jgi:hypothetical protein
MVSATEFSNKPGSLSSDGKTMNHPKRRRFRLFATLAAPFRDIDERAVKKGPDATIRNNSKGNMFTKGVATPGKPSVKRFPRGGE